MIKKKVFVIDMDNTILDTVALKKSLGILLENNPEISASSIVNYFNNGDPRIKEYINNNLKKYIFDGVEDSLKTLSLNKNNVIILLTHGLIPFQVVKTEALNFDEYFDEIILTEDDDLKINNMQKILEKYQDSDVFFINDNLKQNNAIRQEFEKVVVSDIDNYDKKSENDINNILSIFIKQIILDINKVKNKIKEEEK